MLGLLLRRTYRKGWQSFGLAPRSSPPTRLCFVIAYALLFALPPACAQAKLSEDDVKAAYLFNFGKFMRLSNEPVPRRGTFDICIVGQDPMRAALNSVTANEQLDERPVRVRALKQASEARQCDIAYISASQAEHMEDDLAALRGTDVLTVSDAPRFLTDGGMIEFVGVHDHIRFSVNLQAVRRTHLVLSSDLLRVAESVRGTPREAQP